MPPRMCCCGPSPCWMATDDFNRDAMDLGPDWAHPVDQWKTVMTGVPANGYAESRIDGARALNDQVHVVPDTSAHVYVYVVDEVAGSGDIYRIIINAVDIDNYHYAEFVRNGEYDSIVRLGKRTGGADSTLKTQVISHIAASADPRYFAATLADNEFCAQVGTANSSLTYIETITPIPLGHYAGIGGDLGTRFSEFGFLQHAKTKVNCPRCICKCASAYLPPALNVAIHGEVWLPTGPIDARVDAYAYDYDCEFTILWDRVAEWYYGEGWCVVEDQDLAWKIKLNCPGSTPELSDLEVEHLCDTAGAPWGPGTGIEEPVIPVNAGWSCDPIMFEFPLTIIPCYPGDAGNIYLTITITELP